MFRILGTTALSCHWCRDGEDPEIPNGSLSLKSYASNAIKSENLQGIFSGNLCFKVLDHLHRGTQLSWRQWQNPNHNHNLILWDIVKIKMKGYQSPLYELGWYFAILLACLFHPFFFIFCSFLPHFSRSHFSWSVKKKEEKIRRRKTSC